jgi:hypothetical protein
VQFGAGGFQYELVGEIAGDHPTRSVSEDLDAVPDVINYPTIPLTSDERELLVVLARPVVVEHASGPEFLPPNRTIAQELDWTMPKYNRKLDHLCLRFAKIGVRGLVGARGIEARNRRWLLVKYALESGMITPADLDAR